MYDDKILISTSMKEAHDATLQEILAHLHVGINGSESCDGASGQQGVHFCGHIPTRSINKHNPPTPTCMVQANYMSSMVAQLHTDTALAYSCTSLSHSCAPLTTNACHITCSHKLIDAVKSLGEYSNVQHIQLEQHYTIQFGSSNVQWKPGCLHSQQAHATLDTSGLCTMPTLEHEDLGWTAVCAGQTFSNVERCGLSVSTTVGCCSLNMMHAGHTYRPELHQGLHRLMLYFEQSQGLPGLVQSRGTYSGNRLSHWARGTSSHSYGVTYESPLLASSALPNSSTPGPRETLRGGCLHCSTHMHLQLEGSTHHLASMVTSPTSAMKSSGMALLQDVSAMLPPFLQNEGKPSLPLTTWLAASSASLMPIQEEEGRDMMVLQRDR